MKVLLAVAALVAVAGAANASLEDLEFHAWKLKFAKIYGSEEEQSRRKMVWMDNRKLVLEHNLLADQGIKSYRLGMNNFADLDNLEYQAQFRRCLRSSNRTRASSAEPFPHKVESTALPDSVLWTDMGYVTEIKDQDTCGSCWAFSATGALEAQWYRKTGTLLSLSEQQLVDCSWLFGNLGCDGGLVRDAFEYIKQNGGLMSESSYPYEGKEGLCRFTGQKVSALCSGYVELPKGDEDALQLALAVVGPVAIAIDAGRHTFQLYESGVYDDLYCKRDVQDLNHAVLAVGYGTDKTHGDYWLVKNSWGIKWGESGYIKMSRNKWNQCGIATEAIYPVI